MATGRNAALVLAIAGLAACGAPFVYDQASEAEQQAYLDDISQGIYAGLEKSIPHGAGGIYMKMGDRKVEVARRRVEITVQVQDDENTPSLAGLNSSKVLRAICPLYHQGGWGENKVKIAVRFMASGGGMMAVVGANPESCAPYKDQT